MVPAYRFVTYRLSGTLDRVCKLDMEQHCKWISSWIRWLGGKGCTRMRPKLHLPILGHAFRITGIMAEFVIWKAVLCHIDLFERS
jgi:uncharacterized metal-binding protein